MNKPLLHKHTHSSVPTLEFKDFQGAFQGLFNDFSRTFLRLVQGLGECCKLPQWSPRHCPSQN